TAKGPSTPVPDRARPSSADAADAVGPGLAEQDPGAVGGSGDGEPGQLSAEHQAGQDDQTNVRPGSGQQSSGQQTWLESDEVWPDSNGQSWPGGEELWPAASPRGWLSEDAAAAGPGTGQPGGDSTEAWLDSLVAEAAAAAPATATADGAQPGPTEPDLAGPGPSEPGAGPSAGGLPGSWPAADSGSPAQVADVQPSASAPDPVSWASEPATPVAEPPDSGTGQPGERGQAGIPAGAGPRDGGPSAGSARDAASDVASAGSQ